MYMPILTVTNNSMKTIVYATTFNISITVLEINIVVFLLLQVSTNGYFSLGTTPSEASLTRFSSSQPRSIIAPFAADIDTKHNGYVTYSLFAGGSSDIETVSSYIRTELEVSFYGTWMLVAEWHDVALYGESSHTVSNYGHLLQSI